ncbi:cancer-associated gene 1 protein-like [Polyodon spathula]|uniref:cancer-associated gene 1 protein-like n=1 Tax=Polyodon spathula TaxID=7913 RepID=UPI001B7D916E|nr:cancer-associated gene 1 protein-like [Polyodon spathula]
MDHVKNKTPVAKRLAARPTGILNNTEIPMPGVTGVAIPGPETRTAPAKVAVPRSSIITKEKSYQPRSAKDKSIQVSLDNQIILHERNTALEKEVLQLKSDLKDKESAISSCNKLIQDKNLECVQLVEAERQLHVETKDKLRETERLAQERIKLYHDCTRSYEKSIEELKHEHEVTVAAFKERNGSEIYSRDEKIRKLKQQISDIHQEKSRERQQQLEELRKELNRLTEEANNLKRRLKTEQVPKMECKNCKFLTLRLEEKNSQLLLKDRTIEELQSLCKRFGKQLTQQDKLLRMSDERDMSSELNKV